MLFVLSLVIGGQPVTVHHLLDRHIFQHPVQTPGHEAVHCAAPSRRCAAGTGGVGTGRQVRPGGGAESGVRGARNRCENAE